MLSFLHFVSVFVLPRCRCKDNAFITLYGRQSPYSFGVKKLYKYIFVDYLILNVTSVYIKAGNSIKIQATRNTSGDFRKSLLRSFRRKPSIYDWIQTWLRCTCVFFDRKPQYNESCIIKFVCVLRWPHQLWPTKGKIRKIEQIIQWRRSIKYHSVVNIKQSE